MPPRSSLGPDYSARADELLGRLCWYREPPGVRGIVRVVRARRVQKGATLEVTLEVLASAARVRRLNLPRGERVTVSTTLAMGWNQLWMLHPLEATSCEAAMREVEEYLSGTPIEWDNAH